MRDNKYMLVGHTVHQSYTREMCQKKMIILKSFYISGTINILVVSISCYHAKPRKCQHSHVPRKTISNLLWMNFLCSDRYQTMVVYLDS